MLIVYHFWNIRELNKRSECRPKVYITHTLNLRTHLLSIHYDPRKWETLKMHFTTRLFIFLFYWCQSLIPYDCAGFSCSFSISTFQAPRQHWSRQDKLSTIHHFFLFFPSALPHYLLSKWNRQDQIHIITLFYTLRCYWNLDLTDDIYQACTTFSQRPYLAYWTILHVLIYNPHPLPNFQV